MQMSPACKHDASLVLDRVSLVRPPVMLDKVCGFSLHSICCRLYSARPSDGWRARYAAAQKSGQRARPRPAELCRGCERTSNGCDCVCVCCGRCGQLAMRKREPIFIRRRGVKKAIRPFLHPRGLCPVLNVCQREFFAPLPRNVAIKKRSHSEWNATRESLTLRFFRALGFSENWEN